MKVLERKEKPATIVTCPHCGSKLEIESGDIFWYVEIDGGTAPGVTCAVCHKGFDIEGYKNVNRRIILNIK